MLQFIGKQLAIKEKTGAFVNVEYYFYRFQQSLALDMSMDYACLLKHVLVGSVNFKHVYIEDLGKKGLN